ncbi:MULTISPECIES: RidA family protein [Paenibacillus]|uniref:RidA family protein n=1 Tax=Paenibacillus agaridevorans TaxID=171404 RepID=A0A2R5ESX1_9BACL|nr:MULTISPECIES: RidA family protein [Paenibacillus]QNK58624.1 RidA family protein [Paenibacillus sp. PAMC21692]GBG09235.1 RidA family protein [Paenibacillus agaridevorans]
MSKQMISSPRVHPVFGHYSSAVLKQNTMYLAGFGPFDVNQQLVGETIVEQTHQTMQNIRNLLEDNGFGMSDIVRATVYLSSISDWAAFNEVFGQYFDGDYPARTVVACELNGFLVEVECTAIKD